jgi:hypothetical protein
MRDVRLYEIGEKLRPVIRKYGFEEQGKLQALT